ncbi:hypothetical protein PJK45_23440 [Mycobacterium kansasii]|uniref:Uncharacterized protein n=3 Tax=Mycobacterium kansasii TaxID=1768 RepID=A0A1V3X3W3_MYCKA|nr:hypothetical protein [Mycobacterium kansasii]ETZ99465.1 hypothetical protein I547_5721 [Mycobacterium kansasii 824]AGZ49053.1 hypothetical protein MKAN_01125 [Mycobacterium kansasii ATCC 12478]ARG58964.1 hypothetical protein B1T43_27875 [Mycobacterium kansasii]ARG64405.1 hypothetical protein B1T45_27970 [Mycobacterium kansasii]ARG72132.1 hypothetical protein B1T47_27825 [Mycobacterium kansasii]
MTNPDMATILREMKIPEQLTGSQALRDFLLIYIDDQESLANNPERLKQLNGLLILSHLEVVNALGSLEAAAAEQHVEKFRKEINRKYRKRWWF